MLQNIKRIITIQLKYSNSNNKILHLLKIIEISTPNLDHMIDLVLHLQITLIEHSNNNSNLEEALLVKVQEKHNHMLLDKTQ